MALASCDPSPCSSVLFLSRRPSVSGCPISRPGLGRFDAAQASAVTAQKLGGGGGAPCARHFQGSAHAGRWRMVTDGVGTLW